MLRQKKDIQAIEEQIYARILAPEKPVEEKKKKWKLGKAQITSRDKVLAMVIISVFVGFILLAVYYYNIFIMLTYQVEADLAQIETQVQKRKNLIINLGKTVIDYSKHERELFSYLGELRSAASKKNPDKLLESLEKIENGNFQLPDGASLGEDLANWEQTLSQLMAVAEQYPALQLSANFMKYMDAILEFENKIAELRMTYNTSVNMYTTERDKIPGFFFAQLFGFGDFFYFELDADENKFYYVDY